MAQCSLLPHKLLTRLLKELSVVTLHYDSWVMSWVMSLWLNHYCSLHRKGRKKTANQSTMRLTGPCCGFSLTPAAFSVIKPTLHPHGHIIYWPDAIFMFKSHTAHQTCAHLLLWNSSFQVSFLCLTLVLLDLGLVSRSGSLSSVSSFSL